MSIRRKSSAKPEGLSQLNLNAAGIDVGATSHYVAVPADRAEPPVREYEAFTADLYRGLCPNLSRRRPPSNCSDWSELGLGEDRVQGMVGVEAPQAPSAEQGSQNALGGAPFR